MKLPEGLLRGDLRRHTATLLSGSTVALLVTVGIQPVLARLYTPAAFGTADAFVSLVAMLLPLASLKYEDALMLPERPSEAATVVTLAFTAALASSALLLVVIPVREAVGALLGSDSLGRWLVLLAPAILLYRASELLELWIARAKEFRRASAAVAVRSTATALYRVGAGAATVPAVQTSAGGLIVGFMAGHAAAILILLRGRRRSALAAIRRTRFAALASAARRYRRFPLFTMPSSLIGAANGRLPFLLLLFYFDETTVGFFGRAFTSIMVPMTLVGSAVARTFFVHGAEAHRAGSLSATTARVHDRMVMLAALPLVLMVLAGPQLFAVVFGPDWQTAGEYARYCALWFALVGITSPLTRVFDVTERQRADFVLSSVSFLVLSAAFVLGCLTGDAKTAIGIGAIGGAAARVSQLGVLLRIVRLPIRDVLAPYLRYGLYAMPAALLLVAGVMEASGVAVLGAAVFGSLVYGLLCLREIQRPSAGP